MLSSAIMFAALDGLIKLMRPEFRIWDIFFFRWGIGIALLIIIFGRHVHLFKTHNDAAALPVKQAAIFHHFVVKSLFATKCAQPNISVAVAFPSDITAAQAFLIFFCSQYILLQIQPIYRISAYKLFYYGAA